MEKTTLPGAFIKSVAITVYKGYDLANSPFPLEESPADDEEQEESTRRPKEAYIGRRAIQKKFLEFLRSKDARGAFLVTGYRGMGKTSFVNRTLSEYIVRRAENSPEVRVIDINLAQRKPTEEDILRSMISKVYDTRKDIDGAFMREMKAERIKVRLRRWIFFLLAAVAALILVSKTLNSIPQPSQVVNFRKAVEVGNLATGGMLILLSVAILVLVARHSFLGRRTDDTDNPYNALKALYKRCFASISAERRTKNESLADKWISRILGTSEEAETVNAPVASSKELEYGLINFLKHAPSLNTQFIFVFDELDKIEAAGASTFYYEDMISYENNPKDNTYLQQIRERKQAIISIIAGLKNFLTTAQATFIFIAGREMFDATLADISDRQSSLSSIFNYVFYLETLLKESERDESNRLSLSDYVEKYLYYVLFGKSKPNGGNLFSAVKRGLEDQVEPEAIRKILTTLQNFVIYLSYRCNGSPKKIINAVHQFLEIGDAVGKQAITNEGKTILANLNPKSNNYLYFGFGDQYRIGFINYLYRPFLVKFGRSFKHYSDNIVSSTPYLFDHMLKFHAFAFSETNLELIPEVLSTSKTPSLKEHIRKIIAYLANNHLRETEVGLFDFKFYSRTQKEIVYVSKTFEEESAAFNFTLDESYLVKLHVRSKIKELRSIYAKFPSDKQIFSIAYMNGVLGDLHFFDQEYDDAIVSYADAIKPINHLDVETMNIRDFITLIKTKLKLGLTFEKIKSYEEALSFYSGSVEDSKNFLHSEMSKLREGKKIPNPSLTVLLQIVNQCFLAQSVLLEKLGLGGVSPQKLAMGFIDIFRLTEEMEHHFGPTKLLNANIYLVVGNLLFFKNDRRGFAMWKQGEFNEKYRIREYEILAGLLALREQTHLAAEISLPFILYYQGLSRLNKNYSFEPGKGYPATEILRIHLGKGDPEPDIMRENALDSSVNKYIGIFLSHMGDCLLSNYRLGAGSSIGDFFKLDEINKGVDPQKGFLNYVATPGDKLGLNTILYYYYLSGLFFLKRGRLLSYSFQLRKILYVLRLFAHERRVAHDESFDAEGFLDFLEATILRPILEITARNCEHTDRHMINKYMELYPVNNKDARDEKAAAAARLHCLNNISNSPETREAVLLFSYVSVILTKDTLPFANLVNSYNSITTQFARITELNFFCKVCSLQLEATTVTETEERKRLGAFYLYGLTAIIKTLNIYGLDYMVGISFLAYTHYRIANFINEQGGEIKDMVSFLEDGVKEGKSYVIHDKIYHYQLARSLWTKTLQLHSGGHEYKRSLDQSIYLEDDINDNAYHFGAALDRYMICNGTIRRQIEQCDEQLLQCRDFDLSAFVEDITVNGQ